MKQPLRLKRNKWVIKEINLKNKKRGKVIERGEYDDEELALHSITPSYTIEYHSSPYHSKQMVVRINLSVIHSFNGYYHCYQICMVSDYCQRFEMLESGLEKIIFEITHGLPYYENHTLLKEEHHVN